MRRTVGLPPSDARWCRMSRSPTGVPRIPGEPQGTPARMRRSQGRPPPPASGTRRKRSWPRHRRRRRARPDSPRGARERDRRSSPWLPRRDRCARDRAAPAWVSVRGLRHASGVPGRTTRSGPPRPRPARRGDRYRGNPPYGPRASTTAAAPRRRWAEDAPWAHRGPCSACSDPMSGRSESAVGPTLSIRAATRRRSRSARSAAATGHATRSWSSPPIEGAARATSTAPSRLVIGPKHESREVVTPALPRRRASA